MKLTHTNSSIFTTHVYQSRIDKNTTFFSRMYLNLAEHSEFVPCYNDKYSQGTTNYNHRLFGKQHGLEFSMVTNNVHVLRYGRYVTLLSTKSDKLVALVTKGLPALDNYIHRLNSVLSEVM